VLYVQLGMATSLRV